MQCYFGGEKPAVGTEAVKKAIRTAPDLQETIFHYVMSLRNTHIEPDIHDEPEDDFAYGVDEGFELD